MLENFFGCIDSLTELYEFVETIGGLVISLNKQLFLTLVGKCEIEELDDFIDS